jgi:hypothetical protein
MDNETFKENHTPGPWHVCRHVGGEPNGYIQRGTLDAEQSRPTQVVRGVRPRDAALIAAAPELLSALEDIMYVADKDGRTLEDLPGIMSRISKTARAAIAKAEGK